ncbi:MAG: branched-chain amino acid ABC transporter permease [Chloroflexi bacterium]|nr:MAG: branched-chain amino acid ABC transporter permease [Chloroflexota bacterium]
MRRTIRQRLENIDYLDIVLWLFRITIIVAVIWGSVSTLLSNRYSTEQWLNFLVFGLAQGSLYALIALGYTLVYGVLLMINFAHGEFFMSGIFTATVFVAIPLAESGFTDRHPILALLIITVVAMATSTCVAVLTERVAYRPLRRAPRLVPLITAIGASFFWQYFFRGLYGSGITAFPDVALLQGSWLIGRLEIAKVQGVVIVASILLLIGLYIFVMKTKTGKAMRAVAEDKDVAALMGIDVDRVIVITFAVGAAMAGAAGVLYALMYRQVHFFMGFFPGLKAFTAAVLGGIGNVPGAALGGLLLGMFEAVGPNLFLEGLGITAPYQLKDVIAFTMLVLILMFRPQGILGERLAEEKA